jgi:hypothetical protein
MRRGRGREGSVKGRDAVECFNLKEMLQLQSVQARASATIVCFLNHYGAMDGGTLAFKR